MPDPAAKANLLARLQELHGAWLAGQSVTSHNFEMLLNDARALGDAELEMEVLSQYGTFLVEREALNECLSVYQRAHAHAQEQADDQQAYRLARILNGLCTLERRLGHFDQAMEHLLDAQKYAQISGNWRVRFQILNSLAGFLFRANDMLEAIGCQTEALELAQVHGQARDVALSQINLMSAYEQLGDHARVLSEYPHFQQVVTRTPWPEEFTPRLGLVMGAALLAQHRPEEALDWAKRGLQEAQRQGASAVIPDLHLSMSRALRTLNQLPEAHAQVQAALTLAQEPGFELDFIAAHEELSLVLQAQGRTNEAFTALQHHLRLLKTHQEQELRQRNHASSARMKLQLLEREMELTKERNEELEQTNETLRITQAALQFQATHDGLTGLLRRDVFQQQAQRHLPPQGGQQAALLFIDLDHFKSLNDLYGHMLGDEVLKRVTARLQHVTHHKALIGRMGGDEFMVFLPPPLTVNDVHEKARQIVQVIAEPYKINSKFIECTASVGYALAPPDDVKVSVMQQQADLAMYHAKRHGGNRASQFMPGMQTEHEEKLLLTRELQRAEANRELHLHYQARFSIAGPRMRGFEALLRWHNPHLGEVSATRLIQVAEESGLILPIGRWVLREACRQAQKWRFPERELLMSVNVSGLQFDQPHFVQEVQEALQRSGLPGRSLVLELTETMVLRDMQSARQSIQELQALGVQVALDDFGKGYSSLSLLQALPFDHLKIDRLFLQSVNMHALNNPNRILLDIMLQLAHRLNIRVTTEGVETEQQLHLLEQLGCDDVQGFYLAAPQAAQEAEQLLGRM